MRIIVPDCLGLPLVEKAFSDRLSDFPDATIYRDTPPGANVLAERIERAECVLLPFEAAPLTAEVLEHAPALRIVSIVGAGTQCIDLDAAERRDIVVKNTPQAATPAVAEMTIGLMLALARRLPELDANLRSGVWPTAYGADLDGKVLGLVGLGAIGQRVADVARALGMKVVAWSPHLTKERAAMAGTEWRPLEKLMSEADFVSLHLRLADDTAGLIDRAMLTRLKPSAFVINTARASLVDEDALWEVLRDGRIGGAALDVFGEEPLPKPHQWQDLANVILTPHTAWRTTDTLHRFIDRAIANALETLAVEPG